MRATIDTARQISAAVAEQIREQQTERTEQLEEKVSEQGDTIEKLENDVFDLEADRADRERTRLDFAALISELDHALGIRRLAPISVRLAIEELEQAL
jgi:uncharacterized coiled-coil protein SlyX